MQAFVCKPSHKIKIPWSGIGYAWRSRAWPDGATPDGQEGLIEAADTPARILWNYSFGICESLLFLQPDMPIQIIGIVFCIGSIHMIKQPYDHDIEKVELMV